MASRNVNSFFSEAPAEVNIQRSRFERPQNIKTSMNAGELIPISVSEVLPGDTISMDSSKIVRMPALKTPIYDNIWLDTYWFYVPNRLVWEHWQQFMGENKDSSWIPQVTYTMPQVSAPSGGWNIGTIADYMGIPTGIDGFSVDARYFRGYTLICNEWFRDENLTDPAYFSMGDATVTGTNGTNYINDLAKGGYPFKVAKYRDQYTSCLPAPQKGPDTPLPLGASAPVYAGGVNATPINKNPIQFRTTDSSTLTGGFHNILGYTSTADTTVKSVVDGNTSTASGSKDVYPANLYTDLTLATGTSINQLRQAFQIQRFYERDARSGTRYTEILKAHFSVTSPDSRLQRPEYLGGDRCAINIHQVVQSSETTATSPQGNTAAYSLTISNHSDFTRSFTEHGMLFCLCCIRYDHSYQQGLERIWSRTKRTDFYWPVLARLGEQAVKNKEIYLTGTSTDDQVFGYQEAWYEYRYKPNRVTGLMRSNATGSLDVWHLADYYTSMPYLSDTWIREDKNLIDRCLTVTSQVTHQFFMDIFLKGIYVRPMPLYSIPGMIDHY